MTRRTTFDWSNLYRQATLVENSPQKAAARIPSGRIEAAIEEAEYLGLWFDHVYRQLLRRQRKQRDVSLKRAHLRRVK